MKLNDELNNIRNLLLLLLVIIIIVIITKHGDFQI